MNQLKTILTLLAVVVGGLAVLAVIGFIYSFLGYLLIFGVLCLGGYIAFRFLGKTEEKQIAPPDPKKELARVQRLLDEYKRK
jgi:4-hydroxybenzoate polyprenyltransferase